jgi:formylglycine-generating enzyme required for sulfatase activity
MPAAPPELPQAAPPVVEEPPSGRWVNIAVFAAVLLLVIVSSTAFLVFFDFRQGSSSSETHEDPPTNSMQMRFASITPGDLDRWAVPQKVALRRAFMISVTEVTRGQYKKFADAMLYQTYAEQSHGPEPGSLAPSGEGKRAWKDKLTWRTCGVEDDDAPITCVAWEDAIRFCNWLSEKEGFKPCYQPNANDIWACDFQANGYRLPTDAEWEYAARLGQDLETSWALEHAEGFGWFRPESADKPHPVGKKPASPSGLCDVWGNVWEWCWDWYVDLEDLRASANPTGPTTGQERVIWGGGWNDSPKEIAKQPRRGLPPDHRATDVGFRIVRTVR